MSVVDLWSKTHIKTGLFTGFNETGQEEYISKMRKDQNTSHRSQKPVILTQIDKDLQCSLYNVFGILSVSSLLLIGRRIFDIFSPWLCQKM